MVWCEVLLQLPFFFVASYAFLAKKNWIRVPCIIYGAHVTTTMVPIMGDILFGPNSPPVPQRYNLAAIYSPYAVIPFMLVLRMALSPRPFAPGKAKAA